MPRGYRADGTPLGRRSAMPVVDDDDDNDGAGDPDAHTGGDEEIYDGVVESQTVESALPEVTTYIPQPTATQQATTLFTQPQPAAQPMRRAVPVTAPVTESRDDNEQAWVREINECIDKLRDDMQAYYVYMRLKPEYVDHQPAGGWSKKLSFDTIRNADDLVADIENTCGGQLYDVHFYKSRPNGKTAHFKRVRVPINSPAKLPQKAGSNGPTTTSPDAILSLETNKLLAGMVERQSQARSGGNSDESIRALISPTIAGYQQTINLQNDELSSMRKRMDDMQSRISGAPNSEVLRIATERAADQLTQAEARFANERQMWNTERVRLTSELDRERAQFQSRFDEQTSKLADKLEAATDKMRDIEEKHRAELTRKEENYQAELRRKDDIVRDDARRKDEFHSRDMESARRELTFEKESAAKLKEAYELNTRTQLEKQEAIFREQAGVSHSRIVALEERIKDIERDYQNRLRDIEQRRDTLQDRLFDEKTSKPDTLTAMAEAVGTVTKLAGSLGLERPSAPEPAPHSELGQLLKDAKDAGVVDAAKGVLSQVTSAFQRQPQAPQQQPQQVIYQVPVHPVTHMPLVPPSAVQQPQQVLVQQVSAQPQQSQQPVRPPVQQQPMPTTDELPAWRAIIGELSTAFDADEKPEAVAVKIKDQLPPVAVRQIIGAGPVAFKRVVEHVSKIDSTDSPLLSPRGDNWVRALFTETAKALG